MKNPKETEPPLPTPDTAASTESSPEPGPGLQENMQETQASKSSSPSPAGCPEPAAAEAVNATSKAHLFIFDSESQEDDSQSIFSGNRAAPANPKPTVNTDSAFSLTQVQLEEDKQQIRELMKETNQVNTVVQQIFLSLCDLDFMVFFVFGRRHPKEQQDKGFRIPAIFKVKLSIGIDSNLRQFCKYCRLHM